MNTQCDSMKNKPAFPRAGVPSFGVANGPCVKCGSPDSERDWWRLHPINAPDGWYWCCTSVMDCADRQEQRATQTAAGGA